MTVASKFERASKITCQTVLRELLESYLNPAFGALPKKEIDLVLLKALADLGVVSSEPSIYELVSKLRVTRTKARNLIYDQELRRLKSSDLDGKVKDALRSPLIQKQQDLFGLEIENPLVIDHFRSILKELGHTSDGSFSSSMVRVTLDGLVAVVGHFLSKDEQKAIAKSLHKAGVPDKSFGGVLRASIRKLAGKIAKDSGEAAFDSIGEYISPILDNAVDKIVGSVEQMFSEPDPE